MCIGLLGYSAQIQVFRRVREIAGLRRFEERRKGNRRERKEREREKGREREEGGDSPFCASRTAGAQWCEESVEELEKY